jgi:alpha-tubulin suppressor-like RCC1 family protein
MPNIASHNGIDVGNIASINGQDIAAGGAFDPIADTGTYTEESGVGTGMFMYGGVPSNLGLGNNVYGAGYVKGPVVNFSSDKDGVFPHRKQTGDFSNRNWTKFECSESIFCGIDTDGKLWMSGTSASYTHQSSNPETLTQVTSVTHVTDDTAWTDVSVGDDFCLAINAGYLYVLGEGGDGQLGHGSTSDKSTFFRVGSTADWYKVAAAANHSIAIRGASGNRSLWSTGENSYGKCGSGDTSGDDLSWIERVSADASEDWTFVSCSFYNSLAIKAGKVFMCGSGSQEAMGNNSSSNVTTFTQTGKIDSSGTFGTNWTSGQIYTFECSFLINSSGELWFAGEAGGGARGDGNTSYSDDVKSGYHVKVSGSSGAGGSDNWTLICRPEPSALSDDTFAGICNGQLFTWGSFISRPQLGHSSSSNSLLSTATAVANTNTCSYATISEAGNDTSRFVLASFNIS